MEKLWREIEKDYKAYNKLALQEMLDYNKYYMYSIIAHSTAIEGSTLTELETQLLFDEGITVSGKLMEEHLMNFDLKKAYDFAATEAKKETPASPDFLKTLNALVMKNTGSEYNTPVGSFNAARGDYRLFGVTAGIGGKSYINYQKIPLKVEALCEEIKGRINESNFMEDLYNLSFDAHLNLVTIHPWADGNGRTSRLLMNYIQFQKQLVPTKVHKEDKSAYISALETSRKEESPNPFRKFMAKQLQKTLKEEIQGYKKNRKKTDNMKFLF